MIGWFYGRSIPLGLLQIKFVFILVYLIELF